MTKKIKKAFAILMAFAMCMSFTVTAFAAETSADSPVEKSIEMISADDVIPYSTTYGSVFFGPNSNGILPSSGSTTTNLSGRSTFIGYTIQPNGSSTTVNVKIGSYTYSLTADGKYHELTLVSALSAGNVDVSYSGAGTKLVSISIIFAG